MFLVDSFRAIYFLNFSSFYVWKYYRVASCIFHHQELLEIFVKLYTITLSPESIKTQVD